MDSTILQGDRGLITALVAILVSFVTATLSIVRLVNDKEGKTSDHRQKWCDSLRICLADLVSSINSSAGEIVNRAGSAESLAKLLYKHHNYAGPWPETESKWHDHLSEVTKDKDTQVRELRKKVYQSYSLTLLHFKPGDPAISPIEENFKLATSLMRELIHINGEERHKERTEKRNQIHEAADKITRAGQEILKTEWEIVKRGEIAYVYTKRWSVFLLGFAFLLLLSILVGHASSSPSKLHATQTVNSRSEEDTESKSTKATLEHIQMPVVSSSPTVTQIVNVQPPEYRPLPRAASPSSQKSPQKNNCEKDSSKD